MRSPRKFLARFVWIALSLALVFATSGHAWAQNAPPVITAPATITAQEGVFFSVTITAYAQDSTATVILTGPSPGCGISFSSSPGVGQATGTLSGTPAFNCAGVYVLTFTASDGVSTSSATSQLTIQDTDRAPAVTAPATRAVPENSPLTFTVSAVDPDGDAIASLTAASTPPTTGSTFATNAGNTSGTFNWTPSFTAAGSYRVVFTASNALSGSAATSIVVCLGCDPAPVVTAPATASGAVGTQMQFTVTASDPDGSAITSLTAAGSAITAGGTFSKNAANTSGTFTWTPASGQAGTYSVTFTAANALSGSAATQITVTNGEPVVTAPATVTGAENTLITFVVQASDPNGDPISSLTASGTVFSRGATFTTNATNTSGTFSWTPGFTDAGTWPVTFTATSGSPTLSGSATTNVNVCEGCLRAPVVVAPLSVSSPDFSRITFTVSAADPDGEPIASLTASGSAIAAGGSFATNAANTSGTFDWTPTLSPPGFYAATFTATSGTPQLAGTARTDITVGQPGHPPTVSSPNFVSGDENSAIQFTVTASDADGDSIASLSASNLPSGSTFVTNASSTSGTFMWVPTFSQAGSYTVTFTAVNSLSGSHATTVTVRDVAEARAFTTNSSKTIKLSSGKPQWCAHVGPVGGSFQLSDIQLGTVVMRSAGTGSVSEIPAVSGKTNIQGDADNNGIDDGEFCFIKGNLQLLFSNLNGRNTVNVTIAGRLMSGLFFEAPLTVDVNAGGGGNPVASITPNPLNPSGVLSFGTKRAGVVRVRVFDSGGRLVRTVLDTALPAGPHDVPLDARDAVGRPFASGVYFFRVEAPGDVMTGRFVVAK